jgi:hypothetical protein
MRMPVASGQDGAGLRRIGNLLTFCDFNSHDGNAQDVGVVSTTARRDVARVTPGLSRLRHGFHDRQLALVVSRPQ